MSKIENMEKIKIKLYFFLYGFSFLLCTESVVSFIHYKTIASIVAFFVFGSLYIFLTRKTKHIVINDIDERYPGEKQDKYIKRIINLSYLLVYAIAILITNILITVLGENAKIYEVLTAIRPMILAVEYVLMFLLVFQKELKQYSESESILSTKRYIRLQLIFSSVSWLIYLIISSIVGLTFLYHSFFIVSCIFWGMVVVSNLTSRKKVTCRNFEWKKRYTIVICMTAVVCALFTYLKRDTFYLQGKINRIARIQQNTVPIEYDDETGIYSLTMNNSEFKILQLTDIHFGGSLYSIRKDTKALDAVYELIEYTKPDLVIVTGDMTFPLGIMSFSFNNSSAVQQFAAFMRNANIPWAFIFGNHDTEVMSSLDKKGLCDLYESLSFKTSGTLLYPYIQPDITGRNNQVIELYNEDGSLNQALFLIDSNAYTGEGINVYDYIHDDQVEWYEKEIKRLNEQEEKTVSSMVFFHIPLQEYRTAYELYESGSNEVKYFFGSNDEEMIDKVCCSDYPSRLFDKMKELDSTKAVFCGHDHYNNISLEYQGIRLTYGMSIDYLAMPGIEKSDKQRGGTLITINADSTYTIEQISLNEIK